MKIKTKFYFLNIDFIWKATIKLKLASNLPISLLPLKPLLNATFIDFFAWNKHKSCDNYREMEGRNVGCMLEKMQVLRYIEVW